MPTAINSLAVQYLIGLVINIIYIAILIGNQTSYYNIQLPENRYSENVLKGGDFHTYVQPARNFVKHKIFARGSTAQREITPDYHRTVGYPFFLASLMTLFGNYWLISAFFVQGVLFALIYPLLSRISNLLFNASNRTVVFSFLFFILAGTYIIRVPMILTDTFFAVFLTIGLWSGLEAIIKRSYMYLCLHVVFIGYAAQIRPLLSLYPVIDSLILISIAMKYDLFRCSSKVYYIIISSFLPLVILCNLPSIRNYLNHNFLKPTDILSENLFSYLGKGVLTDAGKNAEYEAIERRLEEVDNINLKTNLQKEFAFKIYKEYPLITLKRLTHNAIGILGRGHWPWIARFWGYNFKDMSMPGHTPLKRSITIYYMETFYNIVYLFVYSLFLRYLIRVFKSENILFSLTIVLFIAYFLIPTFIMSGGGSRFRLPVEGLIVVMASCEFEYQFESIKGKLFTAINRVYTSLSKISAQ